MHAAYMRYLTHWMTTMIEDLFNISSTSTACAPRRYVVIASDVDKAYASRPLSTKPQWVEFRAMISLWLPMLPFGLMALLEALSAVQNIEEGHVQLSPFPQSVPQSQWFVLLFKAVQNMGFRMEKVVVYSYLPHSLQ